MSYIDTDKLIKFANNSKDKTIDANDIARFSTADVRENVMGEWIMDILESTSGSFMREWRCNKCNVGQLVKSNFCPNCGAEMRGDNNV